MRDSCVWLITCLGLYVLAIANQHPRANCAAIALGSFEPNLDPVVSGRRVISQQRRWLILIHHQDVDIAVVVEIPECATTAAVMGCESGARFIANLCKSSVPQIAKEDWLAARGKTAEHTLEFGIDVPRNVENVWPAVIVEIENAIAPTDETSLRADARLDCHIVEIAFAGGMIKAILTAADNGS